MSFTNGFGRIQIRGSQKSWLVQSHEFQGWRKNKTFQPTRQSEGKNSRISTEVSAKLLAKMGTLKQTTQVDYNPQDLSVRSCVLWSCCFPHKLGEFQWKSTPCSKNLPFVVCSKAFGASFKSYFLITMHSQASLPGTVYTSCDITQIIALLMIPFLANNTAGNHMTSSVV